MARFSLVLDASVAVKWFSEIGENGVSQALEILESILKDAIEVRIPDLLFYEVANALSHKKHLSEEEVQTATSNLFMLHLSVIPVDLLLLKKSIAIARQSNITVYDACYIAVAAHYNCPLVTANPRHQRQEIGCRVIPIDQWKPDYYWPPQ
jgi:predicted nucleic acid-binding protein